MATSIVGPSSGFDINSIDNAFGRVYGMMGSPSGGGGISGGGTGPFGLQPQGMSGNDLTKMGRSLTNLLGLTGAQLGQLGQGVLGAGLSGVQGGMGVMGTGLQTLQPSINYYNQLMSGNPAAVSMAAGPYASILSGQETNMLNNLRNVPVGGFGSLVAANAPQWLTGQIGNFELAQREAAARGLLTAGGEQAQIGQGIGNLGLGVGQLGTTLTGQGLQGLSEAERAVLQKMQINLEEPSVFQDILASLGVAGKVMTGIGNLPAAWTSGGGGGGGSYGGGGGSYGGAADAAATGGSV